LPQNSAGMPASFLPEAIRSLLRKPPPRHVPYCHRVQPDTFRLLSLQTLMVLRYIRIQSVQGFHSFSGTVHLLKQNERSIPRGFLQENIQRNPLHPVFSPGFLYNLQLFQDNPPPPGLCCEVFFLEESVPYPPTFHGILQAPADRFRLQSLYRLLYLLSAHMPHFPDCFSTLRYRLPEPIPTSSFFPGLPPRDLHIDLLAGCFYTEGTGPLCLPLFLLFQLSHFDIRAVHCFPVLSHTLHFLLC